MQNSQQQAMMRRRRQEEERRILAQQRAVSRPGYTQREATAEGLYVGVMIELVKYLKEAYEKPEHQARLKRNGPECREIFRNFAQEEFITMLQSSARNPDVEVEGDYFQLKKEYNIWDKESLRKLILGERGTYGIVDDEKLHQCYWEVKDDIEALLDERWVRVVDFKEESSRASQKQPRVFFPQNLNNRDVEFTTEDLPEHCQSYLADLWRGLGDASQVKWEQVLTEEPDLLCDQEREILSTSKVKRQARNKARFDDKGRQIQDGEIPQVGAKRRRPNKVKWQNSHLDIDFSQAY